MKQQLVMLKLNKYKNRIGYTALLFGEGTWQELFKTMMLKQDGAHFANVISTCLTKTVCVSLHDACSYKGPIDNMSLLFYDH